MCQNSNVIGHVLTPRLVAVERDRFVCANYGGFADLNVELADPADAAKMIPGTYVIVRGTFISAFEYHGSYRVVFVIAQQAHITSFGGSSTPVQTNGSVMMCQPPQLDALASKLGHELCVQSSLVTNLDANGAALEAAARAPMAGSAESAAAGDPAAITCRADPEHSDAHLTALACARNNYWAWWVQKQRCPITCDLPSPP
jgi:hypothetical protein